MEGDLFQIPSGKEKNMKRELVNVPEPTTEQYDTQPENTGYYQEMWSKRKKMTKWCAILALIVSVIIAVVAAMNAEPADFKDTFSDAFTLFVMVFICAFPIFLLGCSIADSSVSDTAMHAAVTAITGVFTFAVSNVAYNAGHASIFTIIAMIVSLIAMIVGGVVFLAIAAFYAVYIPVSDIYYCVRAHKERKAAVV